MATLFMLRGKQTSGLAPIHVRVQCKNPHVNVRVSTGIEVDVKKWNLSRDGVAFRNFQNSEDGSKLFSYLGKLEKSINYQLEQGVALSSADVRKIVEEVVFEEERRIQEEKKENERRELERKNQLSLVQYAEKYLADLKSGARSTYKGHNFTPASIKTINNMVNRLKEYQDHCGNILVFEKVDMDFYRDFNAFMKGKDYRINTIGKIINLFKTMLACAEEDGYPVNQAFRYKSFKCQRVMVDTIYLTREDLKAMMKVDLSKMDPCYDKARDIFMIGVWTAQRVSDYDHLSKDNITKQVVRRTEKDGTITEREIRTITLIQQKTGKRVIIPCCKELCNILDKYPAELPSLWEQKLNKYIKTIGQMAKLTTPIHTTTTKGGNLVREVTPKYQLITSHTARRTGATLMYLSGMDVYDICKITGHSDIQTLMRYIRANELETFKKISEQYDYFK